MNKPQVTLTGQDSNTMNLLAICAVALRRAGLKTQVNELTKKVFASKSPDEALQCMMEYCEVS